MESGDAACNNPAMVRSNGSYKCSQYTQSDPKINSGGRDDDDDDDDAESSLELEWFFMGWYQVVST